MREVWREKEPKSTEMAGNSSKSVNIPWVNTYEIQLKRAKYAAI